MIRVRADAEANFLTLGQYVEMLIFDRGVTHADYYAQQAAIQSYVGGRGVAGPGPQAAVARDDEGGAEGGDQRGPVLVRGDARPAAKRGVGPGKLRYGSALAGAVQRLQGVGARQGVLVSAERAGIVAVRASGCTGLQIRKSLSQRRG